MANTKHLEIIKQGVAVWNQWRAEHPDIEPDLSDVDLSQLKLMDINFSDTDLRRVDLGGADLRGGNLVRADLRAANIRTASFNLAKLSEANFSEAYLRETDLSEADLGKAYFIRADLVRVDLWGSNLGKADLRWAYLIGCDLKGANLNRADLRWAFVSEVNLREADLGGANLIKANLVRTDLSHANLAEVILAWTHFGDIDLSGVEDLATARHYGPSSIGIDTLYRSKGKIPEQLLRDTCIADTLMKNMSLFNDANSVYPRCFISYSSKDSEFVQKLAADMQAEGIRCWLAPEEMKIGDKTWDSIYHYIRMRDKVLLVISRNSMAADWVEDEANAALEEENKRKTPILFPVCTDLAIMNAEQDWAEYISKTRHLNDFSNWKDAAVYRQAFERLVQDLKADR